MLPDGLGQEFDVFKFRRFRLNLIGFLKLPLDVSEDVLRDIVQGWSANLLLCYLARCASQRIKPGSSRHDPAAHEAMPAE